MGKNEQRPLILEMEDAKIEMAQVINDAHQKHGLPFYVIETIMTNFYTQVKYNAQNELAQIRGAAKTAPDNTK